MPIFKIEIGGGGGGGRRVVPKSSIFVLGLFILQQFLYAPKE